MSSALRFVFTLAVALPGLIGTQLTARADVLVGSGTGTTSEVLRFSDTGSFISTFAAPGNGLDTPRGLAIGPDGNLYVSSINTNSILRYDATTGAFLDTFVPTGTLNNPEDLLFSGNSLLVSEFDGNTVGSPGAVARFDASTGVSQGKFVATGSGGLNAADDIIFGPGGKLYVSSTGSGQVLRYNTDGTFDTVFASGNGLVFPRGLAFDPNGNLLVADSNSNKNDILRFMSDGTFDTTFSSITGLNLPRDLQFGPDGGLYVAEQNGNDILRYNANGTFDRVFASGNGLSAPTFFLFYTPTVVPEPGNLALLIGLGLTSAGFLARRRNQAR